MGPSPRPDRWQPPTGRPARILLVRLSSLGDVLQGLSVLAALRAEMPEAHIGWAVEDRFQDLVAHRSDLDHVHVIPRRAISRAAKGLHLGMAGRHIGRVKRELRRAAWDVVLDLQGNTKSGVVTRLTRAPVRIGMHRRAGKEVQHFFTSRRWRPPQGTQHRVARGLGLLEAFLGRAPAAPPAAFPLTEVERADAKARVRDAGVRDGERLLLLHPGTSGFGSFKRWPADRFAQVARQLQGEGTHIGITLGPGEASLATAIQDAAPDVPLVPFAPPSLRDLAALIACADGFLSADTGPLHLAALVGTPLLGLYGPKDPLIHGPWGRRRDSTAGVLPTLVQPDVACRPCPLRRCADPICMTRLDPHRVATAFEAVVTSAASDREGAGLQA